MITNKALCELIGDYGRARRLVDEAASILEDASLFAVEVTGQFGQTASKDLINRINDLARDLFSAERQMTAFKPTD